MKKTVLTITGIRPDFIRMSEVFKKLDENFNHILVTTGQHYDALLYDVFFKELNIRKPDYCLSIGGKNREHFHQLADLSVKIIELIRKKNLNPDLIIFLGDSNSVTSAISLKKEGYKIAHIEAGMRSGDKRMAEEINRIVCDNCSDLLFVYHDNYREKLFKENIRDNVYIVGNTIVEVLGQFIPEIKKEQKKHNQIILDIHRPENFKHSHRLENIINIANKLGDHYGLPIKLLKFGRTFNYIENFNTPLGKHVEVVDLMSYKEYIKAVYDSLFIISDSGTAQEEPALLDTPVVVPRDYTERPESVENNCSIMIDVNSGYDDWRKVINWINSGVIMKTDWLGDGATAQQIINVLKEKL